MSYAPQLKINGEFKENVMRLAYELEATHAGEFLASRWPFGRPEGVRVVVSDDPVTHIFANGELSRIEQEG